MENDGYAEILPDSNGHRHRYVHPGQCKMRCVSDLRCGLRHQIRSTDEEVL